MKVALECRLGGDMKGVLLVLGHQGTGGARPCPCCTTKGTDFGAPGKLHKAEAALPQMSEAHLSLLQTLHVPCNNLADNTIISI
jgi:hypothetical protein